MVNESEKLKAKIAKAKAEALEKARRQQALATKLAQAMRREDTRRKILAGAWALDRAEKSPEFREEMYRDLSRAWLVRDDDRELFGLSPLSAAEKQARTINASSRKNAEEIGTENDTASPEQVRELEAS